MFRFTWPVNKSFYYLKIMQEDEPNSDNQVKIENNKVDCPLEDNNKWRVKGVLQRSQTRKVKILKANNNKGNFKLC